MQPARLSPRKTQQGGLKRKMTSKVDKTSDRYDDADEIDRLRAENARLKHAAAAQNAKIEQTLGRALGYPLLDASVSDTDDGDVCVGDHVAETLAVEMAAAYTALRAELERVRPVVEAARILRIASRAWDRHNSKGFDPMEWDTGRLLLSASRMAALAVVNRVIAMDGEENE